MKQEPSPPPTTSHLCQSTPLIRLHTNHHLLLHMHTPHSPLLDKSSQLICRSIQPQLLMKEPLPPPTACHLLLLTTLIAMLIIGLSSNRLLLLYLHSPRSPLSNKSSHVTNSSILPPQLKQELQPPPPTKPPFKEMPVHQALPQSSSHSVHQLSSPSSTRQEQPAHLSINTASAINAATYASTTHQPSIGAPITPSNANHQALLQSSPHSVPILTSPSSTHQQQSHYQSMNVCLSYGCRNPINH